MDSFFLVCNFFPACSVLQVTFYQDSTLCLIDIIVHFSTFFIFLSRTDGFASDSYMGPLNFNKVKLFRKVDGVDVAKNSKNITSGPERMGNACPAKKNFDMLR